MPTTPKWLIPWLALLAPLYVISPVAILGISALRFLPTQVLWVLGVYAVTQQISALFTPEPLLASGLALVRTMLMFGLLGIGVWLKSTDHIESMVIGLSMVFVTALSVSFFQDANFAIHRLNHPYMTPTTLGIGAALGMWIAIFSKSLLIWRFPLFILSFIIMLLSGSRGAIISCLVGLLFGSMTKKVVLSIYSYISIFIGLFLIVVLFSSQESLSFIGRLLNLGFNGREVIWYNTIMIIKNNILGGIGSYRLGYYLGTPNHCFLFETHVQNTKNNCPQWLTDIGQPWLIAHNAILQQLAETGIIGTVGFVILFGFILFKIFSSESINPLPKAVISGFLVFNIVDNSFIVPSPFYGEFFWVLVGTQMNNIQTLSIKMPITFNGFAVLVTLLGSIAIKFYVDKKEMVNSNTSIEIKKMFAPEVVRDVNRYPIFVKYDIPSGKYKMHLLLCDDNCKIIKSTTFLSKNDSSKMIFLDIENIPFQKLQTLKILIYSEKLKNILPYFQHSWKVEKKP